MSPNPFLARLARQGKTGHGTRAEAHTSKRLGGKLTPASGAMEGVKGDIRVGHELLVEHKATIHDSMTVPLDWFAKIAKEALQAGRVPAVAINFTTANGKPRRDGSWVAIPEWLFKELLDEGRL